jgi:hypothetical protein
MSAPLGEVPRYLPTGQAKLRLREQGGPTGIVGAGFFVGLAAMARGVPDLGVVGVLAIVTVTLLASVAVVVLVVRREERRLLRVGEDGVLFTSWGQTPIDAGGDVARSGPESRPSGQPVLGIIELRHRALRLRQTGRKRVAPHDPAVGLTDVVGAEVLPTKHRYVGKTLLVLAHADGTRSWWWLNRADVETLRRGLAFADVPPTKPDATSVGSH